MSHFIDLQKAIEMTRRFRENKENVLAEAYRNRNVLLTCETFTRDAFDDLLKQNDCKKIRVYFGMEANNQVKVIVVGVNSADEDILPEKGALLTEQGLPCPPYCSASSPLNS